MIPACLALGWQKTPKRSFSPCRAILADDRTNSVSPETHILRHQRENHERTVSVFATREGRLVSPRKGSSTCLKGYNQKHPTLCTQVPHFMYTSTPLYVHKHPTLCIYPYRGRVASLWRDGISSASSTKKSVESPTRSSMSEAILNLPSRSFLRGMSKWAFATSYAPHLSAMRKYRNCASVSPYVSVKRPFPLMYSEKPAFSADRGISTSLWFSVPKFWIPIRWK